ncbi:free fatty acid receptor 2-like [Ranitomeya imitator]|uniref:free fatty acid receptor 2-like n=1 Tax=Ranitomeya imitator TaxID=111125 RepID=UPI0037E8C446
METNLTLNASATPDGGSQVVPQNNQLVLAVYIFTFLTGLPSNLLAFYAFQAKVRKKPTPVDILLLNLTISDLVLLLFLPLKMREAAAGMVWDMPFFLCPITGFFYYSSIYISTLFLMAVSVERYLGVAFPIKYKLHRKPSYAILASIIFWFLACAHCSIVYVVQYSIPHNVMATNQTKCYEQFSKEQLKILLPVRLELGVVLFFIPVIITLFCYINFVRILLSLPNIQKKRKQRAIGLALATLANFCICFAPYNVSHIVGFIQNESPSWRVNALLLSTFNAALDPIVFYYTSTTVKKTFFNFAGNIFVKLRNLWPCKKLCSPLDDAPFRRESNTERSST